MFNYEDNDCQQLVDKSISAYISWHIASAKVKTKPGFEFQNCKRLNVHLQCVLHSYNINEKTKKRQRD